MKVTRKIKRKLIFENVLPLISLIFHENHLPTDYIYIYMKINVKHYSNIDRG